jgi:hypothetical protein
MTAEAKKLLHASNVYHNEWAGKLAELLVTLTQREGGLGWAAGMHAPPTEHPADDAAPAARGGAKVFFANSGTEANEGALKIARKVGKDRARVAGKAPGYKTNLVCFAHAFHGRSLGALSVTPNEKYQAPFAPLLPGVRVGVLNDHEQLERGLVDDSVCGVIVEPIQGEGGCTAAHTEWLRALRAKCDEHGAVLIYDEVQVSICGTTPGVSLIWGASSAVCTGAVRCGHTPRSRRTATRTSSRWPNRLRMATPSVLSSCVIASQRPCLPVRTRPPHTAHILTATLQAHMAQPSAALHLLVRSGIMSSRGSLRALSWRMLRRPRLISAHGWSAFRSGFHSFCTQTCVGVA